MSDDIDILPMEKLAGISQALTVARCLIESLGRCGDEAVEVTAETIVSNLKEEIAGLAGWRLEWAFNSEGNAIQ
jgi:hypothetical protein